MTFYENRNMIRTPYIKDEYKTFIVFDFFIRNKKIYFVSTYYSSLTPVFSLKIEKVALTDFQVKEQEPIHYLSGAVDGRREFNLFINGNFFCVQPALVKPLIIRRRLVVATLFKNETVAMINRFLSYYRGQGVDYFYLYFNGPELPVGLPQGLDIMYRIWDYPYLLKADDGYLHCAQSVFLLTFKLRHFDDCDWALLIDLDEFVWSLDEGITLIDYLTELDDSVNVVKLQNYWSMVPDSGGPISFSGIGLGWINRTKCIYRNSFKGYFGIHAPKSHHNIDFLHTEIQCNDLYLLHLTTLHPERNGLLQVPILNTGISLLSIEGCQEERSQEEQSQEEQSTTTKTTTTS